MLPLQQATEVFTYIVLAGDEVLGAGAHSRVNVSHPVAAARVQPVYVVVQLVVRVVHLNKWLRQKSFSYVNSADLIRTTQ